MIFEFHKLGTGLYKRNVVATRHKGQWSPGEDRNGNVETIPYSAHFDPEKGPLSPKNSCLWDANAY